MYKGNLQHEIEAMKWNFPNVCEKGVFLDVTAANKACHEGRAIQNKKPCLMQIATRCSCQIDYTLSGINFDLTVEFFYLENFDVN